MSKHDTSTPPSMESRRENWSAYWGQGALHSLSGSFQGSYGGSVHAFWNDVFAGLQGTDRVLDIGTGNGPLPALLCEMRGETVPRIDAIDLARVTPQWLETAAPACRGKIHFHSDTSAEALPFEDGTFTLGISQYGLEYSQLDKSTAELARVIQPGGRIALVMHHADSRLAEVAHEESRLVEALLAADGLMPTATHLIPYLAKAAQGLHQALATDPLAGEARSRFNNAMHALALLAEQSPYPDVLLETREFVAGGIDALLQGRVNLTSARTTFARHVHALADSRFRSDELCTHALTQTGMADLERQLSAHGFDNIETAPIHHQSLLLGWSLGASRS